MSIELPPQYDPKAVEKAIYQKWLDAKVFHAVPDGRGPGRRFSMVIPPPNVTGALHLGHAINGTIQDILARYHRMKGDNTLWMPGIDHAGIATQAVVEKTIFEKEKKSRHDLGREELVRRIWEWKEQFGSRILAQLASIGASCDWDRTRFTLDETCARSVREAFFKMFKDGLIFRGKRLVNWDTHLQTAVADDEIYHETVKGQMTSIRYPVAENDERGTMNDEIASSASVQHSEFLVVATTRPETMLGDTAVAVHPDDPRYKHLIGKHVIVPLVGRRIPVIADGLLVDPKFGTGVVKVTPAHDPNDYATGVRHNLEMINLLTPDGLVNENGQGEFLGHKYSYVGLKFATAARTQVLADLEALGLIAEAKPHEHEVGHSDRSKTPIEPYLSDQWFVRMGDVENAECEMRNAKTENAERGTRHAEGIHLADGTCVSGLAQAAMDAVTSGRVKITPERYAKGYLDWLGQKRDWCISRQLWWGHRIPVWSKHFDAKEQFWGAPGSQDDTDQDRLISLKQRNSISIWFVVDADESRTFQEKWPDVGGFTVFVCAPSDVVSTWLADVGQDYDAGASLKQARELLIESMKTEELKGGLTALGLSAEELVDQTIKHAEISKDQVRRLASDPANRSVNVRALLDQMGFVQDPDVLDTWFSSALWPISTMGWPANGTSEKPEDQILPYFYPTSVLSTAREILTLWVARMVIFGLYCRGDVPFRDVYIHAIIQDGEGRPMKKTLGNGVDPVDIVKSHGADALRFTLASMATETQDIRLPVQLVCPHCHERLPNNINGPVVIGCPKCKKQMTRPVQTAVGTEAAPMSHSTSDRFDIGRNFANKIWNAARYILSNIDSDAKAPDFHPGLGNKGAALEDRWILSRLAATVTAASSAIDGFHFAELAEALRSFFWTDLCDWYLEISKARIKAGDAAVRAILMACLETSLKLLHPLMPFVTEEIWSKLPIRGQGSVVSGQRGLLVVETWPAAGSRDVAAEEQIGTVQAVVSAIREIQNRYPAAKGKPAVIVPRDAGVHGVIEASRGIVESLAGAKIAENAVGAARPADAAAAVLPIGQIFIGGVIDRNVEIVKLTKRRGELEKLIAGSRTKLGNEGFVSKAPANVVAGLREQLAKLEEELAAVKGNLAELG